MRLAIPIWHERLSPLLDSASRLLIVEVRENAERSRFVIPVDEDDPVRKCRRIQQNGVDVLICSAVSRVLARMLEVSGVHLIPEISGRLDDILPAFFEGNLTQPRFAMPGCRSKQPDRSDGEGCRKKDSSRKRTKEIKPDQIVDEQEREERMGKTTFAIPLANGKLCAHFGHCEQFALIETTDGEIVRQFTLTPPPHEPGVLPRWLSEQGSDVIIAGGMGARAQGLFGENGIKVITGAPADTPEALVRRYLSGSLVTGQNLCDH